MHNLSPDSSKYTKPQRKWSKSDLTRDGMQRFQWALDCEKTREEDLTPASLFELFSDDEGMNFTTLETNRYAAMKGEHDFSVTPSKLKLFFSILLLLGINPLPRRRMYFSSKPEIGNEAVCSAMGTHEFENAMRFVQLTCLNKYQ